MTPEQQGYVDGYLYKTAAPFGDNSPELEAEKKPVDDFLHFYAKNIKPFRDNPKYYQDTIRNWYRGKPSAAGSRDVHDAGTTESPVSEAEWQRYRAAYPQYNVQRAATDQDAALSQSTRTLKTTPYASSMAHEGVHGAEPWSTHINRRVDRLVKAQDLDAMDSIIYGAEQGELEVPAMIAEEKAKVWARQRGKAPADTVPPTWQIDYMRQYGGALPPDIGKWPAFSNQMATQLRGDPAYRQWLKYHSSQPVPAPPKPAAPVLNTGAR